MPCDGKNSNCQRRRELLSQLKCLISSMDRKKPCEWDEPPCPPPVCCPVPPRENIPTCYIPLKPCNSCELRSSLMWRCLCVKRNGLQDRCMLIDCLGRPECMTKLYPVCGPGKKALLKLTDLGDEEVALRKFHSADKAREAALAAYCRLKCGSGSSSPSPNCPLSNSNSPNCPLSNSPPPNYSASIPLSRNCPSNSPSPNPPPCNFPSPNFPPGNFPSPNFPPGNSNSSPGNYLSSNFLPGNFASSNFPTSNFSSASPANCSQSANRNNYPPPPYSANQASFGSNPAYPGSYSQSNNCPPPYNSLTSNYRVSSSASPAPCAARPLTLNCPIPKPRMQSCPQSQNQNQNQNLTRPPPCVTCISY